MFTARAMLLPEASNRSRLADAFGTHLHAYLCHFRCTGEEKSALTHAW